VRLSAILLTILVAGCCSLERTPAIAEMGDDAVEHVIAYNGGWYLFGCLPIVCGNEDLDSWCPFAFFRDEVRHELVGAKVIARAEGLGCDLRDFLCYDERLVFFDCYYAPVPWVLQYKEVNVSANLVRKGPVK